MYCYIFTCNFVDIVFIGSSTLEVCIPSTWGGTAGCCHAIQTILVPAVTVYAILQPNQHIPSVIMELYQYGACWVERYAKMALLVFTLKGLCHDREGLRVILNASCWVSCYKGFVYCHSKWTRLIY